MGIFSDLYSLNVNEHVEKKQGLSYLSWSYAWAEFKKVYEDAMYEVKKDDDQRCYFGDDDVGYMVYTSVTAGGLTHDMWLPIMDSSNKAMKKEAYKYTTRSGEKSVEAMTMFEVNRAVMRCLVKNLAMFGLGLYIYSGEDLPEDNSEYCCEDCGLVFEEFGKTSFNLFTKAQELSGDGKARCSECTKKYVDSQAMVEESVETVSALFKSIIDLGVDKEVPYGIVKEYLGVRNFTKIKDIDTANKIISELENILKNASSKKETKEEHE